VYEIVDYEQLYNPKNSSGGELKNANYVKMPVKPRGKGLMALLKRSKGLEVFGVWGLLLQAATETTKPKMRGKFLNHKDQPANIEEIAEAISLGRQVSKVKFALGVLCEMGWIKHTGNTDELQNSSVLNTDNTPSKISKDKISKDKISRKFVQPTVLDIQKYCKEKNIYVNAKDFIGFYGSKDWMVGKNKMTSWHHAVSRAVNWEINKDKQPAHKEDKKQAEKKQLEKKRQEIRKRDGPYFREKTAEQLRVILKTQDYITRHWLIEEILKEKKR